MYPILRERAHSLLGGISKANSFDEIYDLLGFRYVINPRGTLEQFQDDIFTLIFSCNVLEHFKFRLMRRKGSKRQPWLAKDCRKAYSSLQSKHKHKGRLRDEL